MLTHINNPNMRRAGRSTSRTTIDWTSISQVLLSFNHQILCFSNVLVDNTLANGKTLYGLQGKVEKNKSFQYEER